MDNEALKKELASIRVSVMNILAAREHSIDELRQKLRRKRSKYTTLDDFDGRPEYLESLIETILEQLLEGKLLDESRFTESFIRSRINKGSGPVKIRHELKSRGISSDLASDFLDNVEIYTDEFWKEHIEAVRSKRFGAQYPTDYKEQSKQSRFLYQRGFSGELIQRLFNELK